MSVWLIQIWDRIRAGFWFVPLGMITFAAFFALFMAWVDEHTTLEQHGPLGWLVVNAATARSTLSLLSGGMLTLSGVVFSMTMVTLSLTSSQFGSRLLRTALTDLTMQVSLGMFLATTMYCLTVLRFIPSNADSPFVPHLAVFLGSLLSFVSLVVMIVFVHHISVSIQAQNVVAEVAHDLDAAIQRLFPERLGHTLDDEVSNDDADQPELGSRGDKNRQTLPATSEGYLQTVDVETLLDFACKNDLVIELLYRPGDFVIRESPLVHLLSQKPGEYGKDERKKMTESLNAAIITGHSRTPRQDVCCAVNELVEVAVRALSPGINDPFTAVACIDRMTAALSRLLERSLPSRCRYDKHDHLRVIAQPPSIPHVIESAFQQVIHYGADNLMVAVRVMEGLEQLIGVARRKADRNAIQQQADSLYRLAGHPKTEPQDRSRLKTLRDRICDEPAREVP